MRKVLILNGPNLARLGTREPSVYGSTTYAELAASCVEFGAALNLEVEVRQSDSESELVSWVEQAAVDGTAVVINPAAFTHYSYALREACAGHRGPLIEVHISNPHAREDFRSRSVVSGVATGCIMGLGLDGYLLALRHLAKEN